VSHSSHWLLAFRADTPRGIPGSHRDPRARSARVALAPVRRPVLRWDDEPPGQLRRQLPNCSARMLTLQLRELEKDGLVKRTVYAEVPPRVDYELTTFGRSLEPVLIGLKEWGSATSAASWGREATPYVVKQSSRPCSPQGRTCPTMISSLVFRGRAAPPPRPVASARWRGRRREHESFVSGAQPASCRRGFRQTACRAADPLAPADVRARRIGCRAV
jgi:DNA-binding HxlR family transcriptional regulator